MSVTLSAFYLISLMSTCWTAGDQVPIRGKALRGHTYKTAKAGELFRCYMCCERDPACKSCNFKHTKEICEMNNETKATKPNDFITDEQSYYIRRPGGDFILLTLTTNGRKGRFGVIQSFTVPTTGRYKIKAWGARGGTHSYNSGNKSVTYYGGKGAFKMGLFTLTEGTVLNIVVGHRGGDSVEVKGGQYTSKTAAELNSSVAEEAGTGGGGGSFVYSSSNVLFLAAGGGGGSSAGYNGVNGQAGPNGTSSVGKYSSHSRSGGTGGFPGECDNESNDTSGGVGAGWLAWSCETGSDRSGENGGSRDKGWVGGNAGLYNRGKNGGLPPGAVRGFGGGGGGADNYGASGGGGGYSGGGGGKDAPQAGGGGGSYCNGLSCSGASGGNSNDDGMVQIFELSDEG
ncbi:uncharacterized protein LOC141860800 [Acropora palmata]|uniref:uncharacterized protein LOC141860800 n=1 Tax=Acropora palmata TaxID=6131 RepID=UPI003DA03D13